MQQLKNTSFEIVDIFYVSGRLTDDPAIILTNENFGPFQKNSKELTKIHLNDNRANITNWRLSKKFHEHE